VMALAIIAKMLRSVPPTLDENRSFEFGVDPATSMENDKVVRDSHAIDSRSIRRAMRLRHEARVAEVDAE
jgi:hypothetical protein